MSVAGMIMVRHRCIGLPRAAEQGYRASHDSHAGEANTFS
jgi:hypothetical protein